MHIVAFHGDFASPRMMRRDMSVDWVDQYWDYQQDNVATLADHRDLVLVAYSRGGSVVGKLANALNNIRAAVLYEAPLLDAPTPGGDFPVLIIWNRLSIRRFTREAKRTKQEWALQHPISELHGGSLLHVKLWPPGHGWDQNLNPPIYEWLSEQVDPVDARQSGPQET